MIEFKGSIAVERSPEDVFAFVADPGNRPKYQTNVVGSRVVGGEAVRVGTSFEESMKLGPWKLRTTCEVVVYEAPRRVVFTGRNGMVSYRGEFAIDGAPGGTRLTISGHAELQGWRRILQPMLRAECSRNLRRELERIREILVPAPTRPKLQPTVVVAVAALLALALPLTARAERTPPPELKKTVDAFVGNWSFDGTVTMPGAKPIKTALAMPCKRGALGKAVACTLTGNIPGIGPMDASILVGFDTFHKNVHFMAMTSDEEVHDHVCNWRSPTELACDPLRGGMMGDEITEELSMTIAGDRGTLRSVIKLKDGSQILFELAGKRRR